MVPIEVRAPLLSPAGGWPAAVTAPSAMQPLPPWGETRLAQLFTVLPAEGGNVPYLRDPGQTSAAAPVLEGDTKPESAAAPVLVSEPLSTIAHWLPVSVQSLEDVDGLRAWIDSILLTGLADVQEAQLLNGNGTPPQLRGLLNVSGLTAPYAMAAGQTAADAILTQSMLVQQGSRLPVDAVVLSPSAFTAIATGKTDGTTGAYLSGQPMAAAPLLSLWGIRYTISPALADGTALVGSFRRGAAIYRKGTIRIDVSNSHADYFIKNLVAIRCEMRELLAVFKPKAFGLVTDLVTSP
jgi:HK97 family phage major capsid protein